MYYYQFNIGDYRKKTGHLSLVEHAIYRALLDSYYMQEGPLTLDIGELKRKHCVRTADEVQALENVLCDFFIKTEDGYQNPACDEAIAAYQSKSAKARESAKTRWKNANAMRTHNERNADGMLGVCKEPCESDANHKPITNNQIDQEPLVPAKPKPEKFSHEDSQCAEWIYGLIHQMNPGHKKPNLEKWANTIRLMRERDGKTHREICELFKWANQDEFWRTNILSPEKLRKQWDKLTIRRSQEHEGAKANTKPRGYDAAVEKSAAAFAQLRRELDGGAGGTNLEPDAAGVRKAVDGHLGSDSQSVVVDGDFTVVGKPGA